MAVGLLLVVTPASTFPCNFLLPHRRNWRNRRTRLLLKPLQLHSPSTLHHLPRGAAVLLASSFTKKQQQEFSVNDEEGEEETSSPYKLSSIFVDILKQRAEFGLRNDVVELEGNKDPKDWGDHGHTWRRRRDGHVEDDGVRDHEHRSSSTTDTTEGEEEDYPWSDSEACNLKDEDNSNSNSNSHHRRGMKTKLTIVESHPSILAKISNYEEKDIQDYETTSNYEGRSSSTTDTTEGEEQDTLWSASERTSTSFAAWTSENSDYGDRSNHRRAMQPNSTITKSFPSIPAKFSKYTRGKHPHKNQSLSALVKHQQRQSHLHLQAYYKQKSLFFQSFTPPVITPSHPSQFSYSEHPKVAPLGFREAEPLFSPFGPPNMIRPWTGKKPYAPSKRVKREFDSFKLPPAAMTKVKKVCPPGPFPEGVPGPRLGRTREEILGKPLSKEETQELVREACTERRRQLDLGKDGLTHNMLDLLHRHWKRRRVCRIKCYGVPTVDMENLCSVIEEKSGGKIIRRSKSMLYVFRGRNYNWNTRPQIPLMLWKPPAPIYPPVVQAVPEGSSVEEADNLRALGRRIYCLCRLKRAGMYHHLVKMVKGAFEIDELVKVDCRELDRNDMKKIGAKLRDLVPCVPLSFERHFMLLWRGSRANGNRSQNRDEEATTPECVKDNVDEEIGSQEKYQYRGFTHYGTRSDLKSEHNMLQGQLNNNVSNDSIADRPSDKELTADTDDGQVISNKKTKNLESGEIVKYVLVQPEEEEEEEEEEAWEFDRLWQEAIDSDEAVVLDNSEADLDSVLEKLKSRHNINNYNDWDYSTTEDELSETEDDFQTKSSSGGDVDEREYEDEDGEQQSSEEISQELLLLPPTLTDITIPQDELNRLCALRMTIRGWMRIGTQGISRGIVKSIHSKWLVSEVAKVRCTVPGCNMRAVHDDLERLTGGTVIWMEGPAVVIYRGKDYTPGWIIKHQEEEEAYRHRLQSLGLDEEDERDRLREGGEGETPSNSQTTQAELDELLGDLGPQYTEWNENGHVPVDADLLVPPPGSAFKSSFRRLPYGMRPRLTNFEMTDMRHLARKVPPHFALGKRRGLEGLASAIIALWEKIEVVKVVIKRGVLRTDNDRIAAELLRLTGGDLVARNMTYIALFRGNDFLPPLVARTLEENNRSVSTLLEEEERLRLAGHSTAVVYAPLKPSNAAGTLAESLDEEARWDPWRTSKDCSTQTILDKKAARDQALQRMRRLLTAVTHKIDRAESELKNLDVNMRPKSVQVAKENVSVEEMHSLQKIGLRMKPFLLLGRREVFGGTIENMHLNWKWRELVKIIVKTSYFMYREKDAVERIARMLETESGGVVVGICPVPIGHAIIVYRGKNYQRPTDGISPQGHPHGLRPRGLLTKRQAWQRFNQKRRKLSLEKHLQKLERDFGILQADLKIVEEADINLDASGCN